MSWWHFLPPWQALIVVAVAALMLSLVVWGGRDIGEDD